MCPNNTQRTPQRNENLNQNTTGCLLGTFVFFSPNVLWHSKTISQVVKIQGKGSSTATWHIISDSRVKMEFSPHNLKIQILTLLFSTFCHIQWTCSIKIQINVSVQKEHLILKIRYSLLSSSLLQLFIEFTMLINKQHMTKLLKTAVAHSAVLKFSLHHPDMVLLLLRTGECLWKTIYQFNVQNKYTLIRIKIYKELRVLLKCPQQFKKNCLSQ